MVEGPGADDAGRGEPAGHDADVGPQVVAPPFRREGARLLLDEVDLFELASALQGRPAFLASDAALAAVFAELGARTLPLGLLAPPALLKLAADAGWWAAVGSVHELDVALAAGFEPSRCAAVGRVKDDGFVMDALTRGVGALAVHDADEAANTERIAALLGLAVPPAEGAPPLASDDAFAACGGLLASVLRCTDDELWIDAPLPEAAPRASGATAAPVLDALAVTSEEALDADGAPPAREVVLRGWSRGARPDVVRHARLSGCPSRGDALVIVLPDALAARPLDPVHVTPDVVLVHGHLWRPLERRELPPPPPEG